MLYRKFGRDGWDASILGFGCMRLPTSDGIPISANIVEDEAIRMIRRAIDEGINYLDTAYTYHEGRSEVLLGKALRDGYRERVHIATKSPVWLVRTRTTSIVFWMSSWRGCRSGHRLLPLPRPEQEEVGEHPGSGSSRQGGGRRGRRQDRPRRLLLSRRLRIFEEIIDGYDGWSMCQIQYNYMDTENQAGTRGLQYAASRGIAVVVMEPLLGGNLARPPADVRELFHAHGEGRTPAEWALQWIWDQPEVAVVLSGMSDMGQLEENILTARNAAERRLGREDMELIAHVRETFERKAAIPCTGCGYCLPCPQGVDIPAMCELYNNGLIYDDLPVSRFRYFRFYTEADRAGACTACGECEGNAPRTSRLANACRECMPCWGGRLYPQGHAK